MGKLLLTITICVVTLISKAQNASVEKTIFGIQVGVVGIWFYNESKLANSIALRSEIGLESNFEEYTEATFYLAPVIALEPKWYYNLKKRNSKGKDTSWNSGNFVSIEINYVPDWIVIPFKYPNWVPHYSYQISIIPTWGIRRNIGNHFNYEAGLGIGWEYIFKKDDYPYNLNTGSFIAINLHLRIGYRF